MALATNTKPASHASSSKPAAASNTKSSGSFPAVLIPRDMLRADLEARTPKDLTSLIFSLMDRFPDTVPFVAKQTNTALVFAPSGKGLSNTIVVPTAKWLEKDQEEGCVGVDQELGREAWDADPTPVDREAAARLDKENAKKAEGRKPASGKESVAQGKKTESAAQPAASRKRAASRTRSPSPKPHPKRRKRASAPTDDKPSQFAATSAPFDPAGVYTITCPYLSDQWPEDCSGPLTLRLALSSTGRHLWGAFKFGIVEGILRSTSPPPFVPDTTIAFDWRGREMGEYTVTWDEGNVGTLTLAADGTLRGTLDGAFLSPDQCVFFGRKKVGDKRFRAPGERLVKQWKREWRRLPGDKVDQGNVIYVDEALEEAMRQKEPPLPSDTTEDETIQGPRDGGAAAPSAFVSPPSTLLHENGREAVLLSALLDLEDENERCQRLLIEYQAVNILNQLYNAQLKKLAERETKGKKNTPKGRLMGNGMPVVLTGDEFYQRVVEYNEDQKRRLAEKEAWKVGREGYKQALEEWETKRKAQKDAWEVRREEWRAEVKRWEGAKARWMKRKAEGKVSGRFAQKKPLLGTRPPAIPRPKLAESNADTGDSEGEAFDNVSSSNGTSEDEDD